MKSNAIKAFEILDSRGTPTIAALIETDDDFKEIGFVPSGASTGSREAIEKRDGGNNFNGKGVAQVIKNAEENLFPELIGMKIGSQVEFDSKLIELDGTKNKKILVQILSFLYHWLTVSCQQVQKKSLYTNIFIITLGKFFFRSKNEDASSYDEHSKRGAHANNQLDFQEFMIQPVGFSSFKEGLICGVKYLIF